MISPLAITLALAFWAPYNHDQPICPNGVKIHQAAAVGASPSYQARDTDTGELIPQCDLFVDRSIHFLPVADQCAFVARNIGTSFMGLPASDDPRNIMYGRGWVTPAACHPVRSRLRG